MTCWNLQLRLLSGLEFMCDLLLLSDLLTLTADPHCWLLDCRDNLYYQLGDGTTRRVPTKVEGISGAVSISGQSEHTVSWQAPGYERSASSCRQADTAAVRMDIRSQRCQSACNL